MVIAEIVRPRGNRGEMMARSLTDVPGRLQSLRQANVRLASGVDRPIEIAGVWLHQGDWVLKLAGVDSIDAANEFRGADLWVPISDRALLPEGEYFQSDLTGCDVVDRSDGQSVGTVQGWQQYGGTPLMEVHVDGREVLIPFVASECEVDLAGRVIRANLPGGILDL